MRDLNELFYYEAVVRNGGFSAAARDIGVAKSILSRRVREMEDRLGIRLIDRTTHTFKVTELGMQFYERCRAAVVEMEAAEKIANSMTEEPRGDLTVTCPPGRCADIVSLVLLEMMEQYPKLRVRLLVSVYRFNLLEDGIDVAIRSGPLQRQGESDLVVKRVLEVSSSLVAGQPLLDRMGEPETPDDLASYPTIGRKDWRGTEEWYLQNSAGSRRTIRIAPRISSPDLLVHLRAAERGGGIAFLPEVISAPFVMSGALKPILTDWVGAGDTLHIAFASRRGMRPAVRVFIDTVHQRLTTFFREKRTGFGLDVPSLMEDAY
ncbi:LysR substrate-binding domain-containing protein [Consotaella aegiceratis]|uniref:LysR substrate-binding domain-containing protein n=1 Tax=Consotaella aegiceratis TaxID=3097961 RepID=UPI002F40D615